MFWNKPPPTPTAEKVKFEFFAPQATAVAVVGSFSGWEQNPVSLKRGKNGSWSGAAELKPGRYEYRFLVDGRWENDPQAVERVSNPFGSSNCVVKVGRA
jgi:1,4-alpha-glucan branching enzyme